MKYSMLVLLLVLSMVTHAQPSKREVRRMAITIRQADSLFTARDWHRAIAAYEGVLRMAPANGLSWSRLGYSYHNISNYDKALFCYLKSLEFKPTPSIESVIQSRLARVYSLKNDSEKAFQSLDKALQLGYSNINELESHNDFNNIRTDARFANVIKRANANAYPYMGSVPSPRIEFLFG